MALLSAIRHCHFWQHVQIPSNGVTDATYYRWRREYGGLKVDQVKRLKELEAENARLADLRYPWTNAVLIRSATRRARAAIVKVGFAVPAVGMTAPVARNRFG